MTLLTLGLELGDYAPDRQLGPLVHLRFTRQGKDAFPSILTGLDGIPALTPSRLALA